MGAVLHTLNLRLPPAQLAHIVNHAEDKVIIVDATPVAAARPDRGVSFDDASRRIVVIGDGDTSVLGDKPVHDYAELLAAAQPELRVARAGRAFARVDVLHERHDRRPEGRRLLAPLDLPARARHAVELRHRRDRGRPAAHDRADVPRQRVGHPVRRVPVRRLAALPRPAHDAGRLGELHRGRARDVGRRPSRRSGAASCSYGGERELDLSSVRMGTSGGAAIPRSLDGGVREAVRRAHHPGLGHDRDLAGRRHGAPAGRRRARHRRGDGLADEVGTAHRRRRRCASSTTTGDVLPWDGEAVGEIEVRGPWITGSLLPRSRRPRSSTTAGCAPATSARSTTAASSRSPTARRT